METCQLRELEMNTYNDISLKPYNTFGIDVRARNMIQYDSVQELQHIIKNRDRMMPDPVMHIGSGSNLLFLDDFPGTILLSNITHLDIVHQDGDSITVNVGAGMVMDDFIARCVSNGWYGLENLSLIPGQVGASAVQNIGAYGVEVADRIVSVHCVSLQDGTLRTFANSECSYGYRHSIFKEPGTKGNYAVVSVDYKLSKTFVPHLDYGGIRNAMQDTSVTAHNLRKTIIAIRRQKLPDPQVLGNAGSFFMNPIISRSQFSVLCQRYPDMPSYTVDDDHVKVPAGWMIEKCGWKGRSLGNAAVHDLQALVLVNRGGATGTEIKELCMAVRAAVQENFGITINPEVNFIP